MTMPFDFGAAVARMTTDNTRPHRERWPALAWVWDELDELRGYREDCLDTHASADEVKGMEQEIGELSDEVESLRQAMRTALDALDNDDTDRAKATLLRCVE
jgi:HAMP domain-containing protein